MYHKFKPDTSTSFSLYFNVNTYRKTPSHKLGRQTSGRCSTLTAKLCRPSSASNTCHHDTAQTPPAACPAPSAAERSWAALCRSAAAPRACRRVRLRADGRLCSPMRFRPPLAIATQGGLEETFHTESSPKTPSERAHRNHLPAAHERRGQRGQLHTAMYS